VIVADTNLISYLLIQGERTAAARLAWQRDPGWLVPTLWRSEFLNVLWLSVRAGVLNEAEAHRVWEHASEHLGLGEREPDAVSVLRTALRDGITAYDAQFVCVAEELGLDLVTSDGKLLAARPDLAVSLEEFAGVAGG
jgi:predicted nucleic acid-binding protein